MKLPYLSRYTDRTGKPRNYIRRPGFFAHTLTSEFGTAKFLQEYTEAMKSLKPRPAVRKRPKKERAIIAKLPRWLKPGTSGVYLIKGGERMKIGYSADVAFRIRDIQVGCPFVISVVGVIVGADEGFERTLHARFDEYRVHGEWFEYGPRLAEFAALVRTKQGQGFAELQIEGA